MSGARVRWRPADERFEVIDHGVLWFDDDSSIIGTAAVAGAASLTELRHALDRYRETMYDGEFKLNVYDVDEALLLVDEYVVAPCDVSLEFAHEHTFVEITLGVDGRCASTDTRLPNCSGRYCSAIERSWLG